MKTQLDDIDLGILAVLQDDSGVTHAQIGERVGLSAPAANARVRRLQQQGYVRASVALLEREALGLDALCFVQVSLRAGEEGQRAEFLARVQSMAEVLECYRVSGEFDYLLKLVTRDRAALAALLDETLATLPGVERISTHVAISQAKFSHVLPLGLLRSASESSRTSTENAE